MCVRVCVSATCVFTFSLQTAGESRRRHSRMDVCTSVCVCACVRVCVCVASPCVEVLCAVAGSGWSGCGARWWGAGGGAEAGVGGAGDGGVGAGGVHGGHG